MTLSRKSFSNKFCMIFFYSRLFFKKRVFNLHHPMQNLVPSSLWVTVQIADNESVQFSFFRCERYRRRCKEKLIRRKVAKNFNTLKDWNLHFSISPNPGAEETSYLYAIPCDFILPNHPCTSHLNKCNTPA